MKILNRIFQRKTPIITINYLSHNRQNQEKIWEITSFYLNKLKDENKQKIHLNILATSNYNWEKNMPKNISYTIKYFKDNKNNYINKIKYAVSCNSPFSVKLDEDCFINNFIWDFIIENINFLDNKQNLLISPLLSNNIPLVDIFIDSFIKDVSIKHKLFDYFLKQKMPNGLWGEDYSFLNKNTIDSSHWDYNKFYENLTNSPITSKGIHPIRICAEAQILLNDYIIKNYDRINTKYDYSFKLFDRPYFTTSTFVIKTSDWKKLLKISAKDSFDEIQLNVFKNQSNMNFYYIENGFSIHTVYNTIFGNKNKWAIGLENGEMYEDDFINNLLNVI
jgi:hypothetical protein